MPTFTVSARGKSLREPICLFIVRHYSEYLSKIDSVYGFMRNSPFYGGRGFSGPQLSRQDLFWMYDNGIGLRLPVSGYYFDHTVYRQELQFFRDFHKKGNSVICTNDDLAMAIKNDFPLYSVEASVIKNISVQEDIDKYLAIYDSIVLPMRLSSRPNYLVKLRHKERLILFANAGCAYNCPNSVCYEYISKMAYYKQAGDSLMCSKRTIARPELGFIHFNTGELIELGFTRFKILRSTINNTTGF